MVDDLQSWTALGWDKETWRECCAENWGKPEQLDWPKQTWPRFWNSFTYHPLFQNRIFIRKPTSDPSTLLSILLSLTKLSGLFLCFLPCLHRPIDPSSAVTFFIWMQSIDLSEPWQGKGLFWVSEVTKMLTSSRCQGNLHPFPPLYSWIKSCGEKPSGLTQHVRGSWAANHRDHSL